MGALQCGDPPGCWLGGNFQEATSFVSHAALPLFFPQDPVTAVTEDICLVANRLDASALVMTAHK